MGYSTDRPLYSQRKYNTTNSHFADAIDFPIFSHRLYLKIAFPLMRPQVMAVATPFPLPGRKSTGCKKYISLTYAGLNCGHCGQNLFKTFALSRRRWRVSLYSSRNTIYSDPVVSRNKGNLELPFMSVSKMERPPFHANCRRGMEIVFWQTVATI